MSTANEKPAGLVNDSSKKSLSTEVVAESVQPSNGRRSSSGTCSTLRYSSGEEEFDYRKVFAPKGTYPTCA